LVCGPYPFAATPADGDPDCLEHFFTIDFCRTRIIQDVHQTIEINRVCELSRRGCALLVESGAKV
jgi:hypothetical protein